MYIDYIHISVCFSIKIIYKMCVLKFILMVQRTLRMIYYFSQEKSQPHFGLIGE